MEQAVHQGFGQVQEHVGYGAGRLVEVTLQDMGKGVQSAFQGQVPGQGVLPGRVHEANPGKQPRPFEAAFAAKRGDAQQAIAIHFRARPGKGGDGEDRKSAHDLPALLQKR